MTGDEITRKVRFGFFAFSKPTVLFFGSDVALRGFQDALSALTADRNLRLETDERFYPLGGSQITVALTDKARGMRVVGRGNTVFKWNLSKDDVLTNIEKIAAVIESKKPCHNYLDGIADDVEVTVSKGEYPDTFAP